MTTSLQFDDLDLLPADPATAIATDGYYIRVVADGTDVSNAEAIVSSVVSDLFDGSSHEVTGWESAMLPLKVEVISPWTDGLSLGAARLIATCRKEGIRPLTLTPDGATVASVWDVLVATFKHEHDDLAEVLHGAGLYHRRTYTLTLRCKPFARSETAVSLPGLAVGGAYSEAVLASGTSTTGWSTTSRYITRRNLMKNPSFENGTSFAPWKVSTGTLSSPAPVVIADVGAPQGANVLKVTAGALAANTRSHMLAEDIAVTPGQSYPILARIKAGHSSQTLAGLLVRWYDGSGTKIGADDFNTVALTTSAYATISISKVAPGSAKYLRVYAYTQVNATAPSGRVWYLDAIAGIDLETVATTTYFDGDTPDGGGLTYYFAGSNYNSADSLETGLGSVSGSSGAVFPHGSTTSVDVINVPDVGINMTWTGAIDVSTRRYIRIKANSPMTLTLDGIAANVVASGVSGSWYVYYFGVPASIATSAAAATLTAAFLTEWVATRYGFKIAEIATVSSPTAGTGRTISRAITTVGSMPAEATVEVTNNGNVLGDHLVIHSGSNTGGFQLLRATRTAGPTQTAASTSISGLTSTLATTQGSADTFQIPVSQIPEATYLFSAFLTGASLTNGTTYTFSYRASIIEDPAGTPVEHSVVTAAGTVKATATTFTGKPVDLGLLNLPTSAVSVAGTNTAVMQLQLWVSAGTWTLDEAWLADVDNGQISVVDFSAVGLSGKVTNLEVVPAAADRPQQQYLATSGTAPNTITREIIPTGWAAHRFDPADGDAQVNVINTATTPGLAVAIEFYPRWDVYAAPVVGGEDA